MALPVIDNGIDVMQHKGLVCRIAARFGARTPYEESDQFQSGFIGLMIAARHYDPSRGTTFAGYACKWIMAYIKQWTVGKYRSTHYRPTFTFTDLHYLDDLDDADPTIGAEVDPCDAACSDEVNSRVRGVMRVLDARSCRMVEQRVMLGRTLEEVGSEYGVTRERARQIVEKALLTLEKHPNTYKVLNGVQYA